jgi:NitT/TauT family transport system permease protein
MSTNTAPAKQAVNAKKNTANKARATLVGLWPALLVAVIVVGLWYSASNFWGLPRYILPSPDLIVMEAIENPDSLLRNGWVTFVEALAGFTFGVLAAVFVALLLDSWRFLEKGTSPYLIIGLNVPIVAIAPAVIIWFGFGMASKIVVAAILTFFPVVIYTLKGLKSADRREVDLFSVLSASRFQELIKLRMPSSLPFFFAALRVASAASVLAAVVAEFIQANAGIGYLILTAAYTNNTPRIWAAVAVSATIALIFYGIVTLVERKVIPWHASVGPQ